MELLSPAGGMDCLVAAVQNGADAVYFGGGSFNARRFANNFCGDELTRAVDYCHERGVRSYITLNTLLFNRELSSALDFAAELYRIGVDAVLVQDLGLAGLIKQQLPGLILHASTQMGIHDLGGLEYCRDMGLTRAVLAREVSMERIEFLAKNSDIEIETFAHGALCMSFSGSCLYSSMSGERSGNRGTCAQPCRKRACVSGRPGENDFCLSPNDISMLEQLPALQRAGVACVKIEGRMKKSEYVATVTRCYRAAIDGAEGRELRRMQGELFELFNRGSFSTSHLYGDSVRTDRVGSSKPGRELVTLAQRSVEGENIRRAVDFSLKLSVGEPAALTARFSDGAGLTEHFGAVVQRANKPQTAETYEQRLAKLGCYPLEMGKCRVEMDEHCYLSAAELNALRREACDALLNSLHVRNEVPNYAFPYLSEGKPTAQPQNSIVYARVRTAAEAGLAFGAGAEYVGIEPLAFSEAELAALKSLGRPEGLVLILPNVIITDEAQAKAKAFLESGVFCGVETNNIGQWRLGKELPVRIAGIGMNAMNSATMDELVRFGFDYIIPSQELTAVQTEELCRRHGDRILLLVHGRVPLMQLLHCPVKEHMGCRNCGGSAGTVTDEAGRQFPLVNTRFSSGCLVRMLNCSSTDLIDIYGKLPSCRGFVLSFIGEKEEAVPERISALYSAMDCGAVSQLPGGTRGHWNRKVD